MAAGGLHDKYFDSDSGHRCYSLVKCTAATLLLSV